MYAAIAGLSYALAYALRFEFRVPGPHLETAALTIGAVIVIRHVAARLFKLSAGRWRFVGTGDIVRLIAASGVGTLALLGLDFALPLTPRIPRSVLLIDWVLHGYLLAGVWLAYRLTFERLRQFRRPGARGDRRIIIVGAGEAGNLLAREMLRLPTSFRPVAFVDDAESQHGRSVQGVRVLGATAQLPEVAGRLDADEIILAIPSARPADLRRIVEHCEKTGLPFKVLPGISEVLSGNVRLSQLREVRIEDLLGREPVVLELPELAADIEGAVILITGAAGSVGSELTRQIALHRPATLVALDQAESELCFLEADLREAHPGLHLVSVVGDITDVATLERLFRRFAFDRVFHAAAYKHVPMMEENPREAVRNNVLGTYRVAEAAGRHHADKFVLISSDKAVRPANVMGATKRLAELVVLELQDHYATTAYSAVRFGNVLGSKGSVLPVFRRQLEAGRPLTVTHPDVTRYFMTIPEAVQLVLQASLLEGIRGRVAMLEMGVPVRILDLARNLRRLAGLPVQGGIVFTGLRPGEKLHEELVAPEEETEETAVHKVRIVRPSNRRTARVCELMPEWSGHLEDGRDDLVLSHFAGFFPNLVVSLERYEQEFADRAPEVDLRRGKSAG
ncbi:MAG: nucleoside-diphosphate sugar epimerase/dehydratase [Gemmatimonadota bacterium]